jgi:hypothetical protein
MSLSPSLPTVGPGDLERVAAARLAKVQLPCNRVVIHEDALAIVMRLAVQPAHAADALGLLHELEVQQIELQMQIDELQLARLDRPA